jgi:enamine deaminase RidA (YjgF/YER057c/UK114 family)
MDHRVMTRRWSPDTVAAPLGNYNHLVEVPAGNRLLFISGQVGIHPDGSLAGSDAQTQTLQALSNIEALLAAEHATPADLVRLMSFVVGRESLDGFRAALTDTFERWFPQGSGFPGHSLLLVQGLARPDFVVEIEAWFSTAS